MNQRQFRGKTAPVQPIDPDNRAQRQEPNPPSKKRMGIQYGAMSAARPGLVGKQDYKRGKRGS